MPPDAGARHPGQGLSTNHDHTGISKCSVLRKQFTTSAPNMQGLPLMDFSHLYENVNDTAHVPSIPSKVLIFLREEVAWCLYVQLWGRPGLEVFIK